MHMWGVCVYACAQVATLVEKTRAAYNPNQIIPKTNIKLMLTCV